MSADLFILLGKGATKLKRSGVLQFGVQDPKRRLYDIGAANQEGEALHLEPHHAFPLFGLST